MQGTLKTAVMSDAGWSKRPQDPQAVQSRGSQGKPGALQRSWSWAGTTTRSLGQATSPGYGCGRLRHMAGDFLRLPGRSPIIHPVVAPAGAHSSPTASRQRGRKKTGAINHFTQPCLD